MRRILYIRIGSSLAVSGAAILLTSLMLLGSYPGVSTGIALLVLGLVVMLLGVTAPGVSADLADLLVRVGYENLGRMLEEIGLSSRALYLPSSVLTAGARAFVPLDYARCSMADGRQLDDRLVVFCGDGEDDAGLLISTPGSSALSLLEYPPGETLDEVAVALTQLAVSTLRVARGIEVHEHSGRIEVRFSHESVPSRWLSSSVEWCIGSLCGSIAAAVVAEAKQRCVTIESESVGGKGRTVVLAVRLE